MALGKWIGGFLGLLSGGPLGAIGGFILGTIYDVATSSDMVHWTTSPPNHNPDIDSQYAQQGERNGFLFSLMVLSAHIIAADGKIMHSEMEHVRRFLRVNFGEDAVNQGNEILLKLFDYRKQKGEMAWNNEIRNSCLQISTVMTQEQRLQLLAFLCEIAKADGEIHKDEVASLKTIAVNLRIDASNVEQMLNIGGKTLDAAYKVLGITADATDEEVRKAYRKMALQYHPDKVATLGADVQKAAEKKFKEIGEAKDMIFKARNMK